MSDRSPSSMPSIPETIRKAATKSLELSGLTVLVVLLLGSIWEFNSIASGTGQWYAAMSPKWFAALLAFSAACAALLVTLSVTPWRQSSFKALIRIRARLGVLWVAVAAILIILPILFLQYTPWGVVVRGPYLRTLLWAICATGMAWAINGDRTSVLTLQSLLGSALLSGSAIVIASAFTYVTSYPFSLGWSEGNRLWDYSLMFGKSVYRFEASHAPVAYLDIGRQLIGGLPFLFSRVSIGTCRAWLAIVATLPYVLVGVLAFHPRRSAPTQAWIMPSLFGLVFLSQGPIHAPLVICAILVLLAWRLPVFVGALLLGLAGYFAEASRFTWMFAPAMWAVVLELGGGVVRHGRVAAEAWPRAIILGAAGLLGSGLAFSGLLPWMDTSIASSATVSTSQSLLWYRLLPNATYSDGVLFGLFKATGPALLVIAFCWRRYWHRTHLQAFVIVLAVVASLIVGLVVSTKIGGGGDLHNLDMFLIGIFFTAALIWQDAGDQWLQDMSKMPRWVIGMSILSLSIPAYGALLSLQPLSFAAEVNWIRVLADADRPRDLGSLPDETSIRASLDEIRAAVSEAETSGPVLFMDQRQLLTFGYLPDVELLPDYEKKRLMDEALSANRAYFAPFYEDLSEGRFALIVSSPLRTPIKDSEYGFGEENNAWVQWVAKPILCYYEELNTLNEVKVELLVPKNAAPTCGSALPGGSP